MRHLAIGLLTLLAAGLARPADAANACKVACKATLRTCLAAAKTTYATDSATCRALADKAARRACLKTARATRTTAKKTCRGALRTCKTACGSGGGGGGSCGSQAGGWLATVNAYRALANLPPVTEDPALSSADLLHAQYTVENDVLGHSEDPGKPGYTDAGNAAAATSNVAGTSAATWTEGAAIDLWMQGPFHAIGILDPRLETSGFGMAHDDGGTIRSAAALNVITGLTGDTSGVTYPIVFPADGKTLPLDRYPGGESPDPIDQCAGYDVPTGPPLIVQYATTPTVDAHTLTRDGTAVDHCMFASVSSLASRHAVTILPRDPLTRGATYEVSLTVDGATTTWSFTACP